MDDKWFVNGVSFSKNEKIRFVNLIRERPGLWNYKLNYQHKYMKNQEFIDERNRLWEEIVDIYAGKNLSSENRQDLNMLLQRKWRYLRDSYVKTFKSNNPKFKSDPLYLAISSFLDEITVENMRIRSKYKFGAKPREMSKDYVINYKSCEEGEESNETLGNNETVGNDETPVNSETPENDDTLGNDDDTLGNNDDMLGNNEPLDNGSDLGGSTSRCGDSDIPIELDLNVDDENNPFATLLDDESSYNQTPSVQNTEFHQTQPRSPDELDECDIFGQFIAVKLRKMNPQARSRMQFLIHQTIFNDEFGRNVRQANSKWN